VKILLQMYPWTRI